VSAAISAAKIGLAKFRPSDPPEVAGPAIQGPALRTRRVFRLRRPGLEKAFRRPVSPAPADRPGIMRGAARSLLVTPWFAAGTGFVIAAGLWIYSPHTELRFPSSALGDVPCKTVGCGPATSGAGGGQEAVSAPGSKITHPAGHKVAQPRTSTRDADPAASGMTFGFQVIWQRDGGFAAQITLTAESVPASWRLSFQMPGAMIDGADPVRWQPSAEGDGGTASAGAWGVGSWSRQDDHGHGHASYAINFTIMGNGTPSTPTSCVFDGKSCQFS
jgi:hypothetical protein